MRSTRVLPFILIAAAGCGGYHEVEVPAPAAPPAQVEAAVPMLVDSISPAEMERRVARFAPAPITIETAGLTSAERQVLKRLILASDRLHEAYVLQVSPRLPEWRRELESQQGAGKAAALVYFDLMVGPWDRLEEDRPFLEVGPKPPGSGFYPSDLTNAELDRWLAKHPKDRDAFTGYFTMIERRGDSLVAVPYSIAFRTQLEDAARLLREAADSAKEATLADFLRKRATAFLTDDYFASDMAWMELKSRIEPTIGPYEVYDDALRGYKAAFESFITVADSSASAELDKLKGAMRTLEENLPIEARHKNLNRGFESPIRVVDVVYTAGEARNGVQTIAFNLPNDERVREAKGSKKVMLRNVMHAKFDKILTPIAAAVFPAAIAREIEFEPWFTNVLAHELSHGLGPGNITLAGGEKTTVNKALRELYSSIEEAKADVTGLHDLTVLAAKGDYTDDFVRKAFIGHAADLFRSVRFGTGDAHGMAGMIQFNWLMEKGVFTYDAASGIFTPDIPKMIGANRQLATEILTLQAEGSYDRAKALIDRYGAMRPELQAALDRIGAKVPVDIRPQYTTAEQFRYAR